ncbi:hypothetical protein GJ496_009815 [Pomphorhynchus laevis]|nr:hypothetical protein GJ496_009815 [Pomphorhynchus laevis]
MCFYCLVCDRTFKRNDKVYVLKTGNVICNDDYEELMSDRNLSKRQRTMISNYQLIILKQAFSRSPKPNRETHKRLAMETGLSSRVVQVWFQNKRAMDKRHGREITSTI